jgi:hypothetical protein
MSNRELIKKKLRYNASLAGVAAMFFLGDAGTTVIYFVLANENSLESRNLSFNSFQSSFT